MAGDNYYLLSFLKGLDDLGAPPPMTLTEFLDRIGEAGADLSLVETIFLSDDLLQHQAFISGEIDTVEPVVLTDPQLKNEESLPDFLGAAAGEGESQNTLDTLWANYYHHAAEVADQKGSEFLKKWVAYEVGLRNALAEARAKSLEIDPHAYLVAVDLGADRSGFDTVITEWTAAADPLAGLRVLDQARWRWISENDGWFSFEADELAAYAVKMVLLKRWQRLGEEASRKT